MATTTSPARQLSWSARVAQRLRPEQWRDWPRWVPPLIGAVALLWFLLRVLPKPSRAAYPCQRAAFPLASAFVLWVVGLAAMAGGVLHGRRHLAGRRWMLAGACLVLALAGHALMEHQFPARARGAYAPIDGPNSPLGIGRGIHPGRVVWVHDPEATSWDPALNTSTTERYWHDSHTNPAVVATMMGEAIRQLAGAPDEATAWGALFRHFNRERGRGRGDVGYAAGQQITIKVNHVEQRSHPGNSAGTADNGNMADLSPQVVLALLDQLVHHAGVPEAMIVVTDPSRFIANKTFDPCHAAFPGVRWIESDFFSPARRPGTEGRELVTYEPAASMHYSAANPLSGAAIPSNRLPACLVEAGYLINLGVLKGHPQAGITMTGKNWYGAIGRRPDGPHHDIGWMEFTPNYGSYRTMVDMMGHRDLGGKAMLYLLDGLWGFQSHGTGTTPMQWQTSPFDGDYPSSLLASQDPVAIDSVGHDFLRAEYAANMGGMGITGAIDDYLHEAAMADAPPSGTVYDPEQDGVRMASLGAHEHWNHPAERLYSRDLNAGAGIELVKRSPLYRRPTGRLSLEIHPPHAGWVVRGPDGFEQAGTGPAMLEGVPTGRVTVEWQAVQGWGLPPDGAGATAWVATDATTISAAVYAELSGHYLLVW